MWRGCWFLYSFVVVIVAFVIAVVAAVFAVVIGDVWWEWFFARLGSISASNDIPVLFAPPTSATSAVLTLTCGNTAASLGPHCILNWIVFKGYTKALTPSACGNCVWVDSAASVFSKVIVSWCPSLKEVGDSLCREWTVLVETHPSYMTVLKLCLSFLLRHVVV